jgi:hypothetical protein
MPRGGEYDHFLKFLHKLRSGLNVGHADSMLGSPVGRVTLTCWRVTLRQENENDLIKI